MLKEEPYASFLEAVRRGTHYGEAAAMHLGLRDLAAETRRSLGLKLYSWGKHFGPVPPVRLRARQAAAGSLPLFANLIDDASDANDE